MILYSISIIYSPGPINFLGLNQGVNNRTNKSKGFFTGVGVAFLILLLVIAYTGEKLIKKEYLLYTSIVGSIYILYLAYKIIKSSVNLNDKNNQTLTFKDGFVMEIMNPKAMLATLPLATIYFPVNNIQGIKVLIVSFILSLMASSAPFGYALIGSFFSDMMKNEKIIKRFNTIMALLLMYVAFSIFKDHVFLVFTGKALY
jgi:threonine/homoserine/homoserine lactone efflux protein